MGRRTYRSRLSAAADGLDTVTVAPGGPGPPARGPPAQRTPGRPGSRVTVTPPPGPGRRWTRRGPVGVGNLTQARDKGLVVLKSRVADQPERPGRSAAVSRRRRGCRLRPGRWPAVTVASASATVTGSLSGRSNQSRPSHGNSGSDWPQAPCRCQRLRRTPDCRPGQAASGIIIES